ncbi:hypothetical protein TrST_g12047 [Triparma strigata]|uniref:LNS2/PITP domain-containing protein n=1 Tax=Triparma strigata TaxID=1606541 RepID=A0A9W7E0S6_9STRA|nr:hypothetical protein TrST_g12047 [Triparma strigata]
MSSLPPSTSPMSIPDSSSTSAVLESSSSTQPTSNRPLGGDCLDVLLVLPNPTSTESSGQPTPLSSSDWIVSLRREGRVMRYAKRGAKGMRNLAKSLGRRLSVSGPSEKDLQPTGPGEKARHTGVLQETFDDDVSDEEEDEDDDNEEDDEEEDFEMPNGEGQGSPRSEKKKMRKRDTLKAMASGFKANLKKMARPSTTRRRSVSEDDSTYSTASTNLSTSERSLPSIMNSSSSSPTSSGTSPVKQTFIGSDSFTVHVYINSSEVTELQMRLVPPSPHAIFVHSNSTKPDPQVIHRLIESGKILKGINSVIYENIYQTNGRTKSRTCSGRIFLWNHDDILVVSDIDGTITKSDVVGLVDSIGMDGGFGHTHNGVCEFYTELEKRDLRFVYLTSRPISLMGYTRKFISNLKQGSKKLPVGLMLCHTGSVRDVLITELVKKNPNEFKADVLRRQIVLPFAAAGRVKENKLFIAGFGNKLTDMKAYSEVGMSLDNIFIIDKKSSMLCESERAELEVEAFNAVEGGGRVNAYRRNSIINRLPPDIALSLHEREEERRSSLSMTERSLSMGGEGGDGRDGEEGAHWADSGGGGGEGKGRLSINTDAPAPPGGGTSPKARRGSALSPKNLLRKMGTFTGRSSDSEKDKEKEPPQQPSQISPPNRKIMQRSISGRTSSFDMESDEALSSGRVRRSGSVSERMGEVRHKMKDASMDSYADGRLLMKIENSVIEERNARRARGLKEKQDRLEGLMVDALNDVE